MKFIAKATLVLFVIALALGAIMYNLLSANVKQSGTFNLVPQNISSEPRTISSEVTQVDMNGPFDLVIAKSDQASLTVQGDARLLSRVIVQQEGKVLHITTKGMLVTMNQTLKVNMTLPSLISLTQTGSGDTQVHGFTGNELSFNMTGSGDLTYSGQFQHMNIQNHGSGNLDLETGKSDHIELISGGSGNVDLVGKTGLFTAVVTGSGNIDAERLIAEHAEAVSHGTGNVNVYASKEIKITSTGSGDVEVYGNPTQKVVSKTGTGDVRLN